MRYSGTQQTGMPDRWIKGPPDLRTNGQKKWISASGLQEGSVKQGRVHGYRSRVRVGRGRDRKDYLSNWAGAVTRKLHVNAKES